MSHFSGQHTHVVAISIVACSNCAIGHAGVDPEDDHRASRLRQGGEARHLDHREAEVAKKTRDRVFRDMHIYMCVCLNIYIYICIICI